MADLRDLVAQLQKLAPDDIERLQSQIDVLERRGLASSHHESHQTHGSHFTQHHTSSVLGLPDLTIEEQTEKVRSR
jgi:hypothetical protein